MVQHASVYNILRKLNSVAEPDSVVLPPSEMRDAVHKKVVENLRRAHINHENTYNTRVREVSYRPGQEVFRRSFKQSNFAKGFNAKLGKQWIKARVVRRRGTCMYDLEDLKGVPLSVAYHAKDLRV